jgi:hypothetical protein
VPTPSSEVKVFVFIWNRCMRHQIRVASSVHQIGAFALLPCNLGAVADSSSCSRAACALSIGQPRSARSLSSSLGSRANRRYTGQPAVQARPHFCAQPYLRHSLEGASSAGARNAFVPLGCVEARPNPSLEPTHSGKQRKPGPGRSTIFPVRAYAARLRGSAQLER